jgi:hypothetical protein
MTDLGEWSRLQKEIAARVGSDPVINDPPRIMRLPGFVNHKNTPVPCTIVENNGHVVSVSSLAALFPTAPIRCRSARTARKGPEKPREAQKSQNVRHFPTWQGGIEGAVERAIVATLPTGHGQRHRAIFNFARRLKGIPAFRNQPASSMRPYFQEWWLRAVIRVRSKCPDESWRDFCYAWARIRKPLVGDAAGWSPDAAMALVEAEPYPAAAMGYCRQEVRRLVALSRKLQQLVGDNVFVLTCRDAARLCCPGGDVERDSKTLWRWMEQLVVDGVLHSVCKGRATPNSGVGSEWEYVAD